VAINNYFIIFCDNDYYYYNADKKIHIVILLFIEIWIGYKLITCNFKLIGIHQSTPVIYSRYTIKVQEILLF